MSQLATAIDNPLHLCRLCGHPESAHWDCSLSGRLEGRCHDCWPRKDLSSLPADLTLIEGSDQHRAYLFADHRFTPKPHGLDILRIGGGDKPAVVVRLLADRHVNTITFARPVLDSAELIETCDGQWRLGWNPKYEIRNRPSTEGL